MGLISRVLFAPVKFVGRNVFTFGNKRPRRLCYAVGLYTIGAGLYDMTYASIMHNSRDMLNLRKRYGNGTYVVISGASDEIGQEFAKRLANMGFSLVLVDFNKSGMEKTKEAVSQISGVDVKTIYFDYEKSQDWQDYESLCKNIQEQVGEPYLISMLINNIEERDPKGAKFHKASDESLIQTINMNSFPLVFMTKFLGPDLKNRVKGDQKSAIINMTSAYSDYPQESLPIFSSGKSFSDVFSQNLWYENQEMDILTVKHMPTKSSAVPHGVDAKDTVDGVLRDLGHERVSYGHFNHSLMRYWILFKLSPWYGQMMKMI